MFTQERESMSKTLIILMVLVLSGCSSLRVSPRGCKNNGKWDKEQTVYEDTVEKSYMAFLIDREVFIKDLVDCSRLAAVKVEIERNFFFHYKVKLSFREE
jgi:uncharacterized protein YceK